MIRGDDLCVPLTAPFSVEALSKVLAKVQALWPDAIVENIVSEKGEMTPLKGLTLTRVPGELLIYKDRESFRVWEEEGWTAEHEHSLFQLLIRTKHLTFVVGPGESEIRTLIDGVIHEVADYDGAGLRTP
jgi:hypothetical protein